MSFTDQERSQFGQVCNSSQVGYYESLSDLGIGNYDYYYGHAVNDNRNDGHDWSYGLNFDIKSIACIAVVGGVAYGIVILFQWLGDILHLPGLFWDNSAITAALLAICLLIAVMKLLKHRKKAKVDQRELFIKERTDLYAINYAKCYQEKVKEDYLEVIEGHLETAFSERNEKKYRMDETLEVGPINWDNRRKGLESLKLWLIVCPDLRRMMNSAFEAFVEGDWNACNRSLGKTVEWLTNEYAYQKKLQKDDERLTDIMGFLEQYFYTEARTLSYEDWNYYPWGIEIEVPEAYEVWAGSCGYSMKEIYLTSEAAKCGGIEELFEIDNFYTCCIHFMAMEHIIVYCLGEWRNEKETI